MICLEYNPLCNTNRPTSKKCHSYTTFLFFYIVAVLVSISKAKKSEDDYEYTQIDVTVPQRPVLDEHEQEITFHESEFLSSSSLRGSQAKDNIFGWDKGRRVHEVDRSNRLLQEIDNFPRKLFGCSTHHLFPHSYGVVLVKDVFPEMDPTINELSNDEDIMYSDARETDLLIYFMHSCPDLDPTKFPGKTIVVSGESKLGVPCAENWQEWNKHCDPNMPTGPRIYWIGPHENSQRNIHAHWGILLLNARMRPKESVGTHTEFDYIFNHALKPVNTREFFLIYAASHCVPFREGTFDLLSKVGAPVHYNGKCKGTKEYTNKVESPFKIEQHRGVSNNKDLFSHYRFALVMENSFSDGACLTEKIFNAYLGGSIPIYYGDVEVMDIFNPKSFIWLDPYNPQPAIDLITDLENNPLLYREYLMAPILKDGERTIEKYFSVRDEIGHGYMKRRIRSMLGIESTMYHFTLLNDERAQIM